MSAQSSWKEILNELQVCMYAGAKRIGQRKVAPRHWRNPCAGYRWERHNQPGADLGGAGGGGGVGRLPFPQGFEPLPTQRVPPLVLFKKTIFGRLTLKFF